MNEKILKTIGFPLKMLNIIDEYAFKNRLSRTSVVVNAVQEYIENHGLEAEIHLAK